jgi:hypothetical protein
VEITIDIIKFTRRGSRSRIEQSWPLRVIVRGEGAEGALPPPPPPPALEFGGLENRKEREKYKIY